MLKLLELSGDVDDVVDANVLMPSILDTSARTEGDTKSQNQTRKINDIITPHCHNLGTDALTVNI